MILNEIFGATLTRDGYYPVLDRIPGHDNARIFVNSNLALKGVAGKWTGEHRAPRKGEFYISGAIPEVYRAPNDLPHQHAIARLVRIEVECRIVITSETPLT